MCSLSENKCEETLPGGGEKRVHFAQLSSNLAVPHGSPLSDILIYSRNKGKGLAPLHRGFRKEPTDRGVLSSSSSLSQLSMELVPLAPCSLLWRLGTEGLLLFLHCLIGALSSGACMSFTNDASFEDRQEIRLSLSKYITSASSWFPVLAVLNSPRGPRCELCSNP